METLHPNITVRRRIIKNADPTTAEEYIVHYRIREVNIVQAELECDVCYEVCSTNLRFSCNHGACTTCALFILKTRSCHMCRAPIISSL